MPHNRPKPIAAKDQSDRPGRCVRIVRALIPGDLHAGRRIRQGAPRGACERAGVSRGHSTEGDVLYREGPNVMAGSSVGKLGGLALKQLTSNEDLGVRVR